VEVLVIRRRAGGEEEERQNSLHEKPEVNLPDLALYTVIETSNFASNLPYFLYARCEPD